MRFNEFNEGIDPSAKAAIKGMRELSGDQYYGLYKTMKDVAGHDGEKQTSPEGDTDHEVSDKPFAYAYTDEEKNMIKGVDPKAKQITSDKSEELEESQLDEIDRRGFLKGAGAVAVAGAAGSAMAQSGNRNTAVEAITKMAGTAWDMRRLGWSRSQAMTTFENKMGYKGELLRVAGLVCNFAWSVPKDHYTRNEFVSNVRQQALKNLPNESVDQGVAEAGNNYHANRTGFAQPSGQRDDERHDLDAPRPTIYALKINGKIWQKDGNTVTFFTKERALAARNSILAKRPELEITLVQRPQD